MAVPTIASVSPSTIYTGGMLITVNGTNFQTAYEPVENPTGPLADPFPTMKVTVGGRVCRYVQVLSATQLRCQTLPLNPGQHAITVQNLDDEGLAIAGEVATMANAVRAQRVDLSRYSDFTRLEMALILELRRQVIESTHKTTATDFDSTPDGTADVVVEIAKLPTLTIQGPQVIDNREYDTDLGLVLVSEAGDVTRRRTFKTVNLTYRFVGMDNNAARNMNLFALMMNFIQNNPFIEMDRVENDPSKGTIQYEMAQVGEFTTFTGSSESDIRGFSGSLVIRGFQVEDVAGFVEQMVAERGRAVDNVIVEAP